MDRIRRMFISVLLTGLIVVSRGQILIRSRGWRVVFPVNGRKSGKIGSLLFGYRPWWHKHRFRRFLCTHTHTHAMLYISIDTVSGKYRWFWYTKSRVKRAFCRRGVSVESIRVTNEINFIELQFIVRFMYDNYEYISASYSYHLSRFTFFFFFIIKSFTIVLLNETKYFNPINWSICFQYKHIYY